MSSGKSTRLPWQWWYCVEKPPYFKVKHYICETLSFEHSGGDLFWGLWGWTAILPLKPRCINGKFLKEQRCRKTYRFYIFSSRKKSPGSVLLSSEGPRMGFIVLLTLWRVAHFWKLLLIVKSEERRRKKDTCATETWRKK